jgi:hypothetical protein
VFAENTVYRGVTGWQSFEPWLSRIENLAPETAWAIAEIIPPEWYGGDLSALEVLLERLLARRARVRELIVAFRESARRPFPNWGGDGGEAFVRARMNAQIVSTVLGVRRSPHVWAMKHTIGAGG